MTCTNYWFLVLMALLLPALEGCRQKTDRDVNSAENQSLVSEISRKSNIIYDSAVFQQGYMHVPPYISNGIIGGCFDHMGFQSRPNKGVPNGRTHIGYIDQYYMHQATTRQAQLPLAYIEAEFADGSTILNMMDAKNYRQELDIYTGVLTTEYDLFGKTGITTFAHQVIPNLLVMKIHRMPESPDKELVIKINCQTATTQQANIGWPPDPVKLEFNVEGQDAEVISSTNMTRTRWHVVANNTIKLEGDQLIIRLRNPENLIRIIVERNDIDGRDAWDMSYDQLYYSHIKKWVSLWERSWIDFPEARAHHIWNRGNYYNLSNFPSIPAKALIPTGMNANIWGFTFPQDVYYVAENLLRSGHFDKYQKSPNLMAIDTDSSYI